MRVNVSLEDLYWGLQPGRQPLRQCWGTALRKQGGRVVSFCWKSKSNGVEYQKMTTNHTKTQTPEVNDFSAFLCVGRCKSLNLVKFPFWYASSLSRLQCSGVFHPAFPSGDIMRGGCSGWWLDGNNNSYSTVLYWNDRQHFGSTYLKWIL